MMCACGVMGVLKKVNVRIKGNAGEIAARVLQLKMLKKKEELMTLVTELKESHGDKHNLHNIACEQG